MPLHSRHLLAATIPALLLSACDDRTSQPQRQPEGGAPVVQVRASADARSFSGRVPRLSAEDAPRDTLRLRRLLGDSVDFASVAAIEPAGPYLLVADRMMSRHLALVDVQSGAVRARAGGHGQGPREFRDPASFLVDSGSAGAWLYDFQNRRLTRIDIRSADEVVIGDSRPLDVGHSLESPVRAGPRMIANGLFPDFTLLVMDSAGTPQGKILADPPFPAREMPNVVGRRMLNRSYLDADPAGERLALAYQWASRIDLFSADGARIGSVRGPRSTEARYRVQDDRFFWDPQGEMAYTAVRATTRYVYALFCGCREADDPDQRSQRLHVFRWNGDFVAEMQLDRRVAAFAVTDDDAVLYAAVSEPYPAVGEWALPASLRMGPADSRTADADLDGDE